jgi:rhamnulokinase
MADPFYIAIDLGAGSGRVFLCDLADDRFLLDETARFQYAPRERDGHLRWEFPAILDGIRGGLRAAGERARTLGRAVRSAGVDSWGVDYGLVDENGELVEDPIAYRDRRTEGVMDAVFSMVPPSEIFTRTGIQFLAINTIVQLVAHARSGIPASAARLQLIPDLVNHALTGVTVTEFTNATTTQLLNIHSGAWDRELIERLGLPARIFGEIVPAGSRLGVLSPSVADDVTLEGVEVLAPATHDTGSAVAGTPCAEGWAYISSGTWSLVGVELERALVNADVQRHNFTNEGGAFGTVRFLKNVMGLWILEACRREWRAAGLTADYARLLADVSALGDSPGVIFPDDPRFLNPPSMTDAIAAQMRETGQRAPASPAEFARVVLDSLALRYVSVLETIERLTSRAIEGVQIVGGGSQNAYLNQATSSVTGRPVMAGPVEATVAGNAIVQAVATGRFATLAEARQYLAGHVRPRPFEPVSPARWEQPRTLYRALEARFENTADGVSQ